MPTRFAAPALALALPLLLGAVSGAAAQSPCGPTYAVEPGDTLFRIARNCGVPSSALRDGNPGIDWDRLRIGQLVTLPGGRPAEPPRGDAREYRIERGDTLSSIARALGVSVEALRAANPDLDPGDLRIGRILRLVAPGEPAPDRPEPDRPAPAGEVRLVVEPRAVEPGGTVTLRLRGLPERVQIIANAGPEGRRDLLEARGRSDSDGRLVLELDIPERARRGERWAVEAGTPRRILAEGSFDIAQRQRQSVTVKGLLTTEGATCPAMRAVDGSLYTLAGELQGYRAGDLVSVTGTLAEASICQQGRTIEIRAIQATR